ncbi:SixA phosphatase family protein [Hymenobacter sp. B81]|uniref:SixA phosphatase family protein n=1 Tax=Hymenobacter sp. B81 TaxID=3344878 RepID=UPI0037DD2C37
MLLLIRFLLLSLALLAGACSASKSAPGTGPATTVYLVRHGEKDTAVDPRNPPLTAAGAQRALALRDSLQRRPIVAVYSTDTRRTRETGTPLATARKLEITPYDSSPTGQAALAARIREQHRGKSVLVVGHSNTVLETIEALGAPRPVPTIGDDEFDYLFEVTIPTNGAPTTARAQRYGAGR